MAKVAQSPVMRMSEVLRGISLEYTHAQLSAATRGWHPSRRLGSGSYGAVYKGELEDGSEVAIKAINLAALSAKGQDPDMSGFDDEVQMLSKFRHPNLVTLLGWGKQGEYRYLVYELLAGGDAFQRLHRSTKAGGAQPFYWFERLSVCLDAATGLSHMHNSKPKAFHRDIKSANILLDRHGTAKMADFGLSCTSSGRQGDQHVTVTVVNGTPGYACPIYARTGRVTEGSEVYSMGMVMLELLTGLAPAKADAARPGGIAYPVAVTLAPGKPGDLERCVQHADAAAAWPAALVREVAQLGLRCVDELDEQRRPRFVEVVRSLRGMTERFPRPSAQVVPPQLASTQAPPEAVLGAACSPQKGDTPRNARSHAADGGGRAQPSAGALAGLEVVQAEGVVISSLPRDLRCFPLAPAQALESGPPLTALVGRQHQADFFEAWLPNAELRNCVSRCAFEVSWGAEGSSPRLLLRGANPVAVDGQIVAKADSVPLKEGSEISFPYATSGELCPFLVLRFVPLAAPAAATTPLAAMRASPASPEASPLPSASWCLRCTKAEGLSGEDWAALPPEAAHFFVAEDAALTLGRQHQPQQFDALLAKSPHCLSFISRAHVQLEARSGAGLQIMNVSSNPVYVDQEPLAKGESRTLRPDQDLSFARLEGSTHVLFLSLRVCAPGGPA